MPATSTPFTVMPCNIVPSSITCSISSLPGLPRKIYSTAATMLSAASVINIILDMALGREKLFFRLFLAFLVPDFCVLASIMPIPHTKYIIQQPCPAFNISLTRFYNNCVALIIILCKLCLAQGSAYIFSGSTISPSSTIVMLFMRCGSSGLSLKLVGVAAIASTVSIPSTTWPNAAYCPSRCGAS